MQPVQFTFALFYLKILDIKLMEFVILYMMTQNRWCPAAWASAKREWGHPLL